MKKKRKIIVISACIVLVMIIFLGAFMSGRLLFRMPASYIERKILKEIPLGSSIQEVKDKIIQHNEWESDLKVASWGNKYNAEGNPEYNTGSSLGPGEYHIGTQHISVDIGHSWYWFADVYFAFDENDKLIDIAVYKEFAIE